MFNRKKWTSAAVVAAMLGTLTSGSVLAFNDVDQPELLGPISALKDRGVISGIGHEQFAPKNKMTYAESIHLLVKAFELSLAQFTFIKAPEASDYYTGIDNDAWYAESFVIAQLNGLSIPKDVNPTSTISREQFAHFLLEALDTTGSYPLIKMLVVLEDEGEIDPDYTYSIQRLILHGFHKPEDGKFYPKREITRGEAAVWVHNAISFVERYKEQEEQQPQQPDVQEEVKVTVEKVNDEVNKVILSREEKPNAGYGIEISAIRFTEDGKAVIQYTLSDPDPDSMNAQVITEPKVETYISAKYEPVAEPVGSASTPAQPALPLQ